VQPAAGMYPPEQWSAWVVPPTAANAGNNTLEVTLLNYDSSANSAGADTAGGTGTTSNHRTGIPVGRGPFNNTDLQPAATYYHSYKVYADKRAGALACQAECDGDQKCIAWSYVIGRAGTAPLPGVERCCRHGVLGCPVFAPGVVSGAHTPGQCNNQTIHILQVELSMPVVPIAACH
jgi:hypothetical protein